MFLSESFASTPAGVIVGVGVPLLAVAFGYTVRQILGRFQRIETALTEQSRALAVLVHDDSDDAAEQLRTRGRLHALENATTALKLRLDLHDEYHREHGLT